MHCIYQLISYVYYIALNKQYLMQSITSKKMLSNKYPSTYFAAKNQTPSVGKAISSEASHKLFISLV